MAVTKLTESPQKEKRRFSYRGYVIKKRRDIDTGEEFYDVIDPKWDPKDPVWTDCGSMAEAKQWINGDISDKAEKDESLNESSSEGDKDWTVISFTFDAALRGKSVNPATLGLFADRGGQFFKDLSEFLESRGLEMAGDYIETNDVTQIYADNDYEFFVD